MAEIIAIITGALVVFAGSFVVALSGAVVPGPLFTVTVVRTIERGLWEGPKLIVGHMLLELLLLAFILLGFVSFLNNSVFIGVTSIAGSLFLIYFGINLFVDSRNLSLPVRDLMAKPKEAIAQSPIVVGILASIGNPYWLIWWVTAGVAFLGTALRFGPAGVVAFFIGHILGDFVWYGFVSFAITKGVRIMTEEVYQKALRVLALAVVLFGGGFGVIGIAKLINNIL